MVILTNLLLHSDDVVAGLALILSHERLLMQVLLIMVNAVNIRVMLRMQSQLRSF